MKKTIGAILGFLLLFTVELAAQTSQTPLRPKIRAIVNRLNKEKVLHIGGPVGVDGRPETANKYYKLYQQLGAKATDNELVSLTADSSSVIVLYAFNILSGRGYFGLKEIFLNHVNDITEVWIAGGCTGSLSKVNAFMLECLNPKFYPLDKPVMTKAEYDNYLAVFDKSRNR